MGIIGLGVLGRYAVTFDDLMRLSDVVHIQMQLGELSHHMINARALSRMKPTAVLVNTSRGPLIDELALVDALREGQIAGASPHTGGFTEETFRLWYEDTA